MFGNFIKIFFGALMALSCGIHIWFSITSISAFKKFNRLGKDAQKKLLLLNYYMVFPRRFTEDELIKLCELPDEEIKRFNKIHDITERVKTARAKLA